MYGLTATQNLAYTVTGITSGPYVAITLNYYSSYGTSTATSLHDNQPDPYYPKTWEFDPPEAFKPTLRTRTPPRTRPAVWLQPKSSRPARAVAPRVPEAVRWRLYARQGRCTQLPQSCRS